MREQPAFGVGDPRLRGGGAAADAERLALAASKTRVNALMALRSIRGTRTCYARLFARIRSANRLNR
jgi:hypothetical protein